MIFDWAIPLQKLRKNPKINSQFFLLWHCHFENMAAYDSKEQMEQNGENNPFLCYLCDATFEDKDSKVSHLQNGCKIFYCAKCDGKFKSKRNLEEHVVIVDYGENQYKYKKCQSGENLIQNNRGK